MSFEISNQRSLVKQLQYVFEDSLTTPANWGVPPASPSFIAPGYNPKFTYTDQPEGVDVRIVGNEGKTSKIKVGEAGLLDVRTFLTDGTRAFAQWLMNAAGGGATTIDDSCTFTFSHEVDGTETWRELNGCLPLNATLDIPNRGLPEITAQILVTQPQDEVTADPFTTPTYVTQPAGPAWSHLSGGANPFTFNSNQYRLRGMSVSITRELSPLDSSGDVNWQFAKAARKVITGTVTSFRRDSLNQAATLAMTEATATRVLVTALSTLTLTNFQIQTHPTNYDSESSDALLEELAFEATDLDIS